MLISLVSSFDIYSGDTINLTLDKPYTYYSIVGNLTEINLDITQEGNTVWITFDKYLQDDSFEIIFFDIEKEVITVYQSSGGGGTRTITKEVIKEVPNYITQYVENETEKIIEKEKIIETEESSVSLWVCSIIGVLGIFWLFWYARKTLKNKYSSEIKESRELEGGQEENEEYREGKEKDDFK